MRAFNWQLRGELNICSTLKLKRIEYAKKFIVFIFIFYFYHILRLISNKELLKFKGSKDMDGWIPDLNGNTQASLVHYQIKLETAPGRYVDGWSKRNFFFVSSGIYEVTVLFDFLTRHLTLDLASVSHVSRYGDDPHCIISRNYFLASFCVCHDRV